VDDDPAILRLLKVGLGRHGFEVVTATHGVDAFMRYKAHDGQFATVLANHNLPGSTGANLAQKLRQDGYKDRIIIMASHLTISDLREYEACNVSGFFSKPFDISMLATMLLEAA
jgi:CheY-like chemotaxis protein